MGAESRRYIVVGQRVSGFKKQFARDLRREMTPAERKLWQHLRRNQLNGFHFRRQQIIDGFIVDFYCHAVGVVVEVDGPEHENRVEYDEEREAVIVARKLRVIRFTNEEVESDIKSVLGRIAQHLTPQPPSL